MTSDKAPRSVLVVSADSRVYDYFRELLPGAAFSPLGCAQSAGEAKRLLLRTPADILIIDTPLPDELGVDLAQSVAEESIGILLLVKAELYERVSYRLEERGILTLPKPNSRQTLYAAVKLLAALSARLQRMEARNKTLQDKMTDIRAVNRAKWLLIERLGMSEQEAHRFIEKRAMDARISRREVAESLIRSYDN